MRAFVIAAVLAASVDANAQTPDASVDATLHLGFTRAPFEAPALSEAKGHGFVFLVEGSYQLAPGVVARVRLPAVLVSLAQPAGAYTDRAVLGNPQVRVARRVFERPTLAIQAGLEVGVPLAGHDADLRANRALAIADGIEGRASPELFTPGVLPATLLGELSFDARPWRIDASVRLPLLMRTSDADMPASTTNTFGVAAVVSVGVRWRFTRRLTAAISTQVFADVAPVHEHARDRAPLQDLERVGLTIDIGRRTELTVGLQAAIGGDLGGSTFGGGIRVLSIL